MNNKELTVNELFSGIGSQRKALERLGIPHKVIGISEIDKYAIKSYEAIFGETRNYGDISIIDKLDYADFWTYSFPCQDISVSGKQAGINENTRSGLLYQVERLLNEAKLHNELPKYLMLENVKNLVGKKFKVQFDKWLEYLEELGYNNYSQVLNAKDYGIPQNRERVFVISIRKDIDDGGLEFPKTFDNGIRLKDLLEESVDKKYYIRQELQDKFQKQIENKEFSNIIRVGGHGSIDSHSWDLVADNKIQVAGNTGDNYEQNGRIYGINGIAPTLSARDYKDPKRILDNSLQQIGTLKGCGLPFDKMHDQAGRVYDPNGIAPTVAAHSGGHLEPKILQVGNINPSGKGMNENVYSEERLSPSSAINKEEESKILQKARGFNKGGLHEISPTISSHSWECNNFVAEPCIAASRGRNPDNPSDRTTGSPTEQRLEVNSKGVSNTITTVVKDNYVIEPKILCPQRQYDENGVRLVKHSVSDIAPILLATQYKTIDNQHKIIKPIAGQFQPKDRDYNKKGLPREEQFELRKDELSNAVLTGNEKNCVLDNFRIRKLTPKECWRLMGFEDCDFYKAEKVNSNTQLYKQAGNSIVVDVLCHIFKNAFSDYIMIEDEFAENFIQPPMLQTTSSSLAI